MITRRGVLKGLGALLASGTLLGGYAFGVEPLLRMRVTRYAPRLPGWPHDLKLRIAVLADIHAGEPYMSAARIRGIVAAANALRADLVLLLGDYTTGHRFRTRSVPATEWADALAGLAAPLGVHAVLGNHDWWDDRAAQRAGKGPIVARLALERVGIKVYENDAVRLAKDGRPFWLAGLGDQLALILGMQGPDSAARHREFAGIQDVPGASRSLEAMAGNRRIAGVDDLAGTLARIGDDAPVILMAHEPDIFPRVPARVALTLSGHTHGGQVRLFGYSPVVPSIYGNRYAYGHVIEHDGVGLAAREKHLIVSGGLGCSIAPIRFGMPPEIVVVELGTARAAS